MLRDGTTPGPVTSRGASPDARGRFRLRNALKCRSAEVRRVDVMHGAAPMPARSVAASQLISSGSPITEHSETAQRPLVPRDMCGLRRRCAVRLSNESAVRRSGYRPGSSDRPRQRSGRGRRPREVNVGRRRFGDEGCGGGPAASSASNGEPPSSGGGDTWATSELADSAACLQLSQLLPGVGTPATAHELAPHRPASPRAARSRSLDPTNSCGAKARR